MAYQPNPNDPYRAGLSDEEIRHQARLNSLDNELQADPSLAEGSPERRARSRCSPLRSRWCWAPCSTASTTRP